MTAATVATNRCKHEARDQHRDRPCLPSVEQLVRETGAVLSNCSVPISRSKISQLVRTYLHKVEPTGYPFERYIANAVVLQAERRGVIAAELARVISYSDVVGETASQNVDRSRGVSYYIGASTK